MNEMLKTSTSGQKGPVIENSRWVPVVSKGAAGLAAMAANDYIWLVQNIVKYYRCSCNMPGKSSDLST